MTKFKLGMAACAAAVLAFGVAACGQTTTVEEDPAAVDAAAPAEAPAEVPADPAAVPADGTTPPADGATTTPPATTP
jgi:hypothetical protein